MPSLCNEVVRMMKDDFNLIGEDATVHGSLFSTEQITALQQKLLEKAYQMTYKGQGWTRYDAEDDWETVVPEFRGRFKWIRELLSVADCFFSNPFKDECIDNTATIIPGIIAILDNMIDILGAGFRLED